MEAFAQSLHTMYSIPTKENAQKTITESDLYDSLARTLPQSGDVYYRGSYPASGDQQTGVT